MGNSNERAIDRASKICPVARVFKFKEIIEQIATNIADLTDVAQDITEITEQVGTNSTKLADLAKTNGLPFYIGGTLTVKPNAMSIIAPCALTVTEIRLAVDTAPTDAALIIDINKNGTTMYTTQENRPAIAIDGISATATDPDIASISLGDKITLDIDQVGSTIAGENLAVTIIYEVA